MKFIGQNRINMELDMILPQLVEKDIPNVNFLLRGKSGYGKTTLGLGICNFLSKGEFQYMIGDNISRLDTEFRIIFIDEVHLLEIPEVLYPTLDKKENIFIFASNEFANLKEPLVNRCIVYTFEDYNEMELKEIAKLNLTNNNYTDEMLSLICSSSNNNPRKIRNLCGRLNAMGNKISINNIEELDYVVEKIIGIVDGLDPMCLKYLEILERLSTSSLENISRITGISKTTIQTEIEPVLLYKNRISITSKGRSFIK